MTNVLMFLSESPISINALQKASGLSQTALTLALIELGGRVGVKDGGIVLLPEAPKSAGRKVTGPRGPIARTLPRLDIARNALMTLVGAGVTDAKAVLEAVGDGARYTDVLLVAREECAKGAIVESRKGRKAVWSLPGGVEVAVVGDEAVADEAVADEVIAEVVIEEAEAVADF